MRNLFPGYFTPSEAEFTALWREATFAFDANVLLGLYRLTSGSRQVFLDVLKKLDDRIFLPNQAAHEYLRHRLSRISARSGSHEAVKADGAKFVQSLETRMQEHSLPKSQEIIETAKQAVKKIAEIVEAAVQKEPDLSRSDEVLSNLTALFDGKTGDAYDSAAFDEVCKKAAARFVKKLPPGYADDKKPEPDKYGDAVIWFQLLDLATSTKKPVVFVTRDTKEDWWLQHNGETIGPRPELIQEMQKMAGVRFYMYAMPRFLEFAQQFFGMRPEPTKKATTEIKEIEQQEKYTAEWVSGTWSEGTWSEPLQYSITPVTYNVSYGAAGLSPSGHAGQSGSFPTFSTVSKEEEEASRKYFQLLPVNGQVFNSSLGKWTCEIERAPGRTSTDRVCYQLKFQPEDRTRNPRHLTLWVSTLGLQRDTDWGYKNAIARVVMDWLNSGHSSGEIAFST